MPPPPPSLLSATHDAIHKKESCCVCGVWTVIYRGDRSVARCGGRQCCRTCLDLILLSPWGCFWRKALGHLSGRALERAGRLMSFASNSWARFVQKMRRVLCPFKNSVLPGQSAFFARPQCKIKTEAKDETWCTHVARLVLL